MKLGGGVWGRVPFLSGCIPDCAEDPGRHTKPELAAALGSSHAARQPTSGTQEENKNTKTSREVGGGGRRTPTQRPAGKPVGRVELFSQDQDVWKSS